MAITDNIVAYYKLDESAGATRVDSVNAYNLADHGTVGLGTGILNGDATFDGATQWLTRTTNTDLNLDGSLSLQAWANITAKGSAPGTIVAKWGDSGTEYILQYDNDSDRFLLGVNVAGSTVLAVANTFGSPSIATWYHLTAGYDQANTLAWIAVNAGTRDTITAAGTPTAARTPNLTLGRNDSAGGVQYFTGQADEVAIWKRVLSTGEATTLYAGGAGLAYPFSTVGPPPTGGNLSSLVLGGVSGLRFGGKHTLFGGTSDLRFS